MNLLVIGTGYVGLVSGICFASYGHNVKLYDNNVNKISQLKTGFIPIYEPGLEDLLIDNKDNINFTDSLSSLDDIDIIFLCVGTPSDDNGKTDLSYLYDACNKIVNLLNSTHKIIVIKSTVPVGTNRKIKDYLKNLNPKANFDIVSNPEFLREGSAIYDFNNPDRIVIGIENQESQSKINQLYQKLIDQNFKILYTSLESSELIKYASNSFLANKVAFINEIALLCEETGANIDQVAYGMGLDVRIGPDFLKTGPGFGGSCFPKDLSSLKYQALEANLNLKIVNSIIDSNNNHKLKMAEKIIKHLNGATGKAITIFGLAFKKNTDDMRESSSILIINELIKHGAIIKAYDPKAIANAKKEIKGIEFCDDPYNACQNSEGIIIITEWDEFISLDYNLISNLMKTKVIVDLRNILDFKALRMLGFQYFGLGKNSREI